MATLLPALVFMLAGVPHTARSEVAVGLNIGVNIPGDQDIKVWKNGSQSPAAKVNEQPAPLGVLSFTVWGESEQARAFGLQADMSCWSHAAHFTVPDGNGPPPFMSATQKRAALLLNAMARKNLRDPDGISFMQEGSYVYGGLGGGPVYTSVQHGNQGWGFGLQALAGMAIPMGRNFGMKIEWRYFLAPDADTQRADGWRIDTSGTPSPFRVSPHLDTRFTGILAGLYWRLPWE